MSAAEHPERTVDYVTFALAPATRAGAVLPRGALQSHRDFLDYIVGGRPLLQLLDDVDAVSPLAADLGPSIFAAHVRRLLLEETPALPVTDGRQVLYGCPECEDLACGAVTAVVERSGDDFIWRDLVWQTDERADPGLNGYPGIGPFRFRGADYRAALEGVLAVPPAGERRRVLLLGKRAAVLNRLASALRQVGIGAEITADITGADAAELRTYGAVAFGRAVPDEQRAAVRAAFAAADADAAFVTGLAPVIPVLVAQIEEALDRTPAERRRLTGLATRDGEVAFRLLEPTAVQLTAYRLDRLYRTRTEPLLDDLLEAGEHRCALDAKTARGESFVVARTASGVQVLPAGGGRAL
ncbi:oxidoreductase [Streptomyces sp. A7024]|uniref:Oxidoreductase n=1 Tax=Streptomyces coryli TaxID=1128680 RepID=A0A6G4U1B6_9ACTN|nr:oxidoreductase [Streptomyces coryli]NGN66025.1 oxidoreductase [Streptomyces coryli]